MKILALDPGLSTGWSIWEGKQLTAFGTLVSTRPNFSELYSWLSTLDKNFDLVICERYIIRPRTAGGFDHSWNSGYTLQIIGAIKSWAFQHNVKIVEQNSDIKKPAHAWAFGTPYKKKKNQHHIDSMLHAIYYMVKQLNMSPKEFRRET